MGFGALHYDNDNPEAWHKAKRHYAHRLRVLADGALGAPLSERPESNDTNQ
jgi:hypothetical protein